MQSFCGDSEILHSWQSKDTLSETRKGELEEARKEGAYGLSGMTMTFDTVCTYGENIQGCDLCEMGVWTIEGESLKQMKTFEGGLWWDE